MLEIKNLTKVFNKDIPDEIKIAVDNLSLTVEDGEFVTIIGGNGSGKSTLMNLISGTLLPDSGKIMIDNIDVTNTKEHLRAKLIARVFQDPMLGTAKSMSVLENFELANLRGEKRNLKWGFKKENEERFIEELKKLDLGLETRLNTKIGLLSGGQRQAITLLMATINNPKLLLLDEHTAALDPKTANIVMKLTEKIVKEKQLTTLMITHNLKDALTYGNRLIMLNNGHIVLDVKGEEKHNLSIDELFKKFENIE